MKVYKKGIAVLVAASLVMGLVPVPAFAEPEVVVTEDSGNGDSVLVAEDAVGEDVVPAPEITDYEASAPEADEGDAPSIDEVTAPDVDEALVPDAEVAVDSAESSEQTDFPSGTNTDVDDTVTPEPTPGDGVLIDEDHDLSHATVSDIATQVYEGQPIEPEPTVTLSGITLTAGVDYALSYEANDAPGQAKVMVTGLDSYTNSCEKTFRIVPSAPTETEATVTGYSTVDVSWTAPAGADYVELWRSTDPSCAYDGNKKTICIGIYNAADEVATAKNLVPSTTYYYKVRAYAKDANGTKYFSGYSDVVSAMTTLDAPTGMKASEATSTTTKIVWTPQQSSALVELWRSTDPSCAYDGNKKTVCIGIYKISDGLAIAKNLAPATTYYYKTRAYVKTANGAKAYSGYSEVVSAKTTLDAPTGVGATTTSDTTISLRWKAPKGAQFVEVWRSTDPSCEYSKSVCIGIYNASDGQSTSKLLAPNTTYYYKFRAYAKDANGKKTYSGYSVIASAKTLLGAPTDVRTKALSMANVWVSWSAPRTVSYVEVWRSTDPSCEYAKSTCIGVYPAAQGYAVSKSLAAGMTYYYKVRAYKTESNGKKTYSAYSKVVSARTLANAAAVNAVISQGSFGFFEAIGATDALDALKNSTYASLTKKGDATDATSLELMRQGFVGVREFNAIRAEVGLPGCKVTSLLMAEAQADANYSDTTIGHARQFNVGENVAWNYGSDPFYQWYDQEKSYFDAAYKGITGSDDVPTGQAAYIWYGDHAYEVNNYLAEHYQGESIGHYMNIINPYYVATGFGITTRGTMNGWITYAQVFEYDSGARYWTVDEYESMFAAYYNAAHS